jgi:hypothetical protein
MTWRASRGATVVVVGSAGYNHAMLAALAAWALPLTAAALLAAGSPARRALGLAASAAGLVAPWLVPARFPLARALVALGAAWGLARVVDLARGRVPGASALRRAAHAFLLVDTRALARASRAVEPRLLGRAALAAAFAAVALSLVDRSGTEPPPVLRWAAAAAFAVATAEALDALVRAAFRLAGFTVAPLQRAPLRSISLREFWGRRWNRVSQGWLSEHVFAPVARRHGATAGTLATFGASAALHAYLLLAAVGPGPAAAWAAFFALHGALVLGERRLGVSRWRPGLARAWTLFALAATAPLFVEPMLRCL